MRKRKIRKRKNNTLIIGIILSILLMSSGYALLKQNINILGAGTGIRQDRLNNKWNIYSSPWYSRIVTAHANLTRTGEVMTNGYQLTTTFTPSSSSTTQRNLALRLTFTNLNRYTLTTGSITSATTTCTNATISTRTVSTTSIAYNATMTFNTTVRLRTSQARNCQFNYTIRYTYSGVNKFFYYTIQIL